LLDFAGTEKIPSYFFPIYPATIHRTSCKNQKLLLGLGASSQESGELRINNNQFNGLFTDFRQFNPYFCRF
jgi:hypothetical protein